VKDAVVRLHVVVPAPAQGLLRDGEIRSALSEAYHFTVAREVKDEARIRLGNVAAGELAPLEALKAWLETRKTSPERMKTLLETVSHGPGSSQRLLRPALKGRPGPPNMI
jgi:hypothetical protein